MVCSTAPVYKYDEGGPKDRIKVNAWFAMKMERILEEIYLDVATLSSRYKCVISSMLVLGSFFTTNVTSA
jgi:hypothetical protein